MVIAGSYSFFDECWRKKRSGGDLHLANVLLDVYWKLSDVVGYLEEF
jgi:hypothetical protein